MLGQFYTTLGVFPDSVFHKSNHKIFEEIKRRTYDLSLKSKTTFFWKEEFMRLLILKLKVFKFSNIDFTLFSAQNTFNNFDDYVSKDFLKYDPDAVYSYGATSMNTFLKAKLHNIQTIYDLPACHWRKIYSILDSEKEKNPNWAETMDALNYNRLFLERCDNELELSDRIIVASNFCKNSLNLFPKELKEIKIIPYGFPEACKNRSYNKNKKLKVLYVGAINQQKGISYLFDAIEPYKDHVELTLIGSLPHKKHNLLEGNLSKFNYLGTLSHTRVLEVMRESDILIFPTLIDAFGMVITEAMSQGTPVITTFHSAGPELINHGENGWVIEPGSSEEIKKVLDSILLKNNLAEIGNNALKTAEKRPWKIYQNEVCDFVKKK
jgi:glycosyltransferase involved in cell wall biosynthesis